MITTSCFAISSGVIADAVIVVTSNGNSAVDVKAWRKYTLCFGLPASTTSTFSFSRRSIENRNSLSTFSGSSASMRTRPLEKPSSEVEASELGESRGVGGNSDELSRNLFVVQ